MKKQTITSMTGFASHRGKVGRRQFLIEAKSVNHRFCEVNVRLPGRYAAWDLPIQKLMRQAFERGRIDVFVKEEGAPGPSTVDRAQFKKAHQDLKRIARELGQNGPISLETVLHFKQNYYRDDERFDADKEWQQLKPVLNRVIDRLVRARQQEGQQLLKWFRQHTGVLEALLKQLKRKVQVQNRQQKARMKRRLKECGFGTESQDSRVAQELAMLIDKMDVTEELVRLSTHLTALRKILSGGGAVGRKIDFLMQEIGREVNTVASKSQDSQVANHVVQFKTEIEKIREQAGNVQ